MDNVGNMISSGADKVGAFVRQLGQNALQNVGEFAQMPGQMLQGAEQLQQQYGTPNQLLFSNPVKYAQTMTAPIAQYAQHLASYTPIQDIQQGDLAGYLPRVGQQMYKNPVTTALDAASIASFAKMLAPSHTINAVDSAFAGPVDEVGSALGSQLGNEDMVPNMPSAWSTNGLQDQIDEMSRTGQGGTPLFNQLADELYRRQQGTPLPQGWDVNEEGSIDFNAPVGDFGNTIRQVGDNQWEVLGPDGQKITNVTGSQADAVNSANQWMSSDIGQLNPVQRDMYKMYLRNGTSPQTALKWAQTDVPESQTDRLFQSIQDYNKSWRNRGSIDFNAPVGNLPKTSPQIDMLQNQYNNLQTMLDKMQTDLSNGTITDPKEIQDAMAQMTTTLHARNAAMNKLEALGVQQPFVPPGFAAGTPFEGMPLSSARTLSGGRPANWTNPEYGAANLFSPTGQGAPNLIPTWNQPTTTPEVVRALLGTLGAAGAPFAGVAGGRAIGNMINAFSRKAGGK